jgi:hypothetical protein
MRLGLCGGEEQGGRRHRLRDSGSLPGEEEQGDDVSLYAVEKVNATAVGLYVGDGEGDRGGRISRVRQPRWRRSRRRR